MNPGERRHCQVLDERLMERSETVREKECSEGKMKVSEFFGVVLCRHEKVAHCVWTASCG
jgi:hypothetical protein